MDLQSAPGLSKALQIFNLIQRDGEDCHFVIFQVNEPFHFWLLILMYLILVNQDPCWYLNCSRDNSCIN